MNFFDIRRAYAIFQKEFKHIFRDPFTLMLALLLPLLIVLILGNSIEFNVKSIDLAYVDHDKTQSSRKLIETFASSDYFKAYPVESPSKGEDELLAEHAKMVLIIPPTFDKEIGAGRTGTVQILLDGADNSSVSAIMGYLNTINVNAIYKIKDVPVSNKTSLNTKIRYLFNPELNSKWFSIPGLSAVIIALVAIMLTTLTVCKEWEQGSMEMLLSTPATTLEIMVGKILPYAFLSFCGFIIVLFAARFIFNIPFVGSYLVLGVATILFIMGYLALGLYISVSTHEQQVAVQYAATIGLLPNAILSGFIFPIEYMPKGYQYLSALFPARFYIDISRSQFLKGASMDDLWLPIIVLAIQGVLFMIACTLRFKRTLE